MNKILRIKEFNIFKWSKHGIILNYKKEQINISKLFIEDKDKCLDLLDNIQDSDIPKQVYYDIKEVKKYLIENFL